MDELALNVSENAMSIFTAEEEEELRRCEEIIETGRQSGRKHLDAIRAMANALEIIKTKTLFRRDGSSFHDYCQKRFGFGHNYARRLMRYADAIENLASGSNAVNLLFQPRSEYQIRALSKLNQEGQKLAWEVAIEAADGDEPTLKDVKAAVEAFKAEYPARPADKTIAMSKIISLDKDREKAVAEAKAQVMARNKEQHSDQENGEPVNHETKVNSKPKSKKRGFTICFNPVSAARQILRYFQGAELQTLIRLLKGEEPLC